MPYTTVPIKRWLCLGGSDQASKLQQKESRPLRGCPTLLQRRGCVEVLAVKLSALGLYKGCSKRGHSCWSRAKTEGLALARWPKSPPPPEVSLAPRRRRKCHELPEQGRGFLHCTGAELRTVLLYEGGQLILSHVRQNDTLAVLVIWHQLVLP